MFRRAALYYENVSSQQIAFLNIILSVENILNTIKFKHKKSPYLTNETGTLTRLKTERLIN